MINKKKFILLLIILTCIFILGLVSCSQSETKELILTSDEQVWLDCHPVLYYAPDIDFAPYEYMENQKMRGMVKEYLDLLEKKLNISIEIIETNSWTAAFDLGLSGESDFLFMSKTQERDAHFLFTEPFIFSPNIIAYNSLYSGKINDHNFHNHTIGVVKNYSSHAYLSLVYPQVEAVEFNTLSDGLIDLAQGNIDGILCDLAQGGYYINKLNLTNIKISGELEFEYQFAFGISKDNNILLSILNKSLASIRDDEHLQISDSWVDITYKQWLNRKTIGMIYIVLFVITLLIIGFIVWNRILKHRVGIKTQELVALNTHLEEKVTLRTKELSLVNEELEASLEELLETQDKLIESTKYASLGKITSRLAHELNTPLGNSITTMGFSNQLIHELTGDFDDNTLTKSTFLTLTTTLLENNEITLTSMTNAASIISKFKLLTLHDKAFQTSYNLSSTITHIVNTMRYENRIEAQVQINIKVDKSIHVTLPAIWLTEIVENIIENSLDHGHMSQPKISIIGSYTSRGIQLTFKDNGKGIPTSIKQNVFEPFTKGINTPSHLGLGLSIVYNLVVFNLGGTIHLNSVRNEFTEITIDLPHKREKNPR